MDTKGREGQRRNMMNDGQKLKYARVRGEGRVYRGKVSISIPGIGLMEVPLVLSLSHLVLYTYTYTYTYYLRAA